MAPETLVFPPFRLDGMNQELFRGTEPIVLRPKTFAFLWYLVRHPQRLLTKEELLTNLWSDVIVSDDLLRGYIRELRVALGDDARSPRYIATVSRRGYKFLPSVTSDASESAPPSPLAVRPPARSTRPPIRVGVLHSLTGMMAASETSTVDATLFAVEELNQRGGVCGRRVEALVADGQSDERVFAREAERLITEEGVRVLFGCWTSASRKTVREVVERHDGLLFYPVQFEGMEESPNIVYTGAAPNQQILPAVRWTFGFLRKRRYFLVGRDTVFSWAAHAVIRDEVQQLDGEIVGEAYLSPSGANVANVVEAIAGSDADIILNTIGGDLVAMYSRALRASGITPSLVPTMYFCVSEVELLGFSPSDSIGDYGAWNYFQSIERPENKAFVDRFRTRYGSRRVVADPMEASYVGVHLWARAVEAADDDDARGVRESLRSQSFDAPEGLIRIDPESQYAWKTMRLGRVVAGGQFEVIWSSERPLRPEPFASTRSPASWTALLSDLFHRWDGHWSAGMR
ncbi:MAG TPA: transporter substrate-binding protein [Polyangiaceae bacterium]|jgi:urea transport system substrate-binding protein|nr:transporter substrate-binding protein [Polyangiaceae bacterium]